MMRALLRTTSNKKSIKLGHRFFSCTPNAWKRVVSFSYTLKDPAGVVLDSSVNRPPFTYLEGVGQIISGLEKRVGVLCYFYSFF